MSHKIAEQLYNECICKYVDSFALIKKKEIIEAIHKFLIELKYPEHCVHCKSNFIMSEHYDAYYCPRCLYWIENICSDRNCEFCSKRPRYPK